jgi:hypothetical protein
VGGLAERFGARAARAEVAPVAARSLEEIAIENAVEGCVGETWGALVALAQAESAGDEAVREAMAGVAEDEARHADLAWAIAAWADRRLDAAGQARVAEARARAARALAAQVAADPAGEALARVAGVPDGERAVALVDRMQRELWAA